MRRRARDLTARARERIRAAREHDPHAWQHGDGEPIDFVSFPEYDESEEPDGDGGGASRTGPTTSAGTRPAFAWASRTRVSTRHHNSYLCWSLQTRPISGRV